MYVTFIRFTLFSLDDERSENAGGSARKRNGNELGLTGELADPNTPDVIEEALDLFRANCLFRNFEIKGQSWTNRIQLEG